MTIVPLDPILDEEALRRVLLTIVPQLSDWIGNILMDPERIQKVANDSYHHANGFDKIVLSRSNHSKLRLHLYRSTKWIVADPAGTATTTPFQPKTFTTTDGLLHP